MSYEEVIYRVNPAASLPCSSFLNLNLNLNGKRNNSSGAWLLSRGDQVLEGGDGSGQVGAAATPNSQDGTSKDRESKQDDAT